MNRLSSFYVTDKLPLSVNGLNRRVYRLLRKFKVICDSVRKVVLYNVLSELGVPMKFVTFLNIL